MNLNKPTFQECFCKQNNLSPEEFFRVVFNRAIYPHARLVSWVLPVFIANYFQADLDLIHGVARLRRSHEFAVEVIRFNEHWDNCGFLRRYLRLRVSVGHFQELIQETLERDASTRPSQNTDGFLHNSSLSAPPHIG